MRQILSRISHSSSGTISLLCISLMAAGGCTNQCNRSSTSAQTRQYEPSVVIASPSTQSQSKGTSGQADAARESQWVLTFLGDSLTAGPGLSMKETLPVIIQQKIGASQLNWTVHNAGVSGDTTALALGRLSWVLRSKPNVMVVALGSNDGLRGLSIDEMESNLRAIIKRAQTQNIKVVLVGQQLPLNFPEDYRVKFAGVFSRLAREYKLSFVPFMLQGVALDERFVLEDGIHPNAAGVEKIAENIWNVLFSVLKSSEKVSTR